MSLDAAEIALYDRQIRLWGIEAQKLMRASTFALYGCSILGAEIAKNLVLAGVGRVDLIDETPVSEDEIAVNFLIDQEDLSKTRAEAFITKLQILNPSVKISGQRSLPENEYDFIILTDPVSTSQIDELNARTRQQSKFYSASLMGSYGFIFADLGDLYEFSVEKVPTSATQKSKSSEKEFTLKKVTYTSFKESMTNEIKLPPKQKKKVSATLPLIRAHLLLKGAYNTDELKRASFEVCSQLDIPSSILSDEIINDFAEDAQNRSVGVAAIVGGILAQDALNAAGRKEEPINNFFVFDGNTLAGPVYKI